MPRGVKGSGKKKATPVAKQNNESANAPDAERKARKPYPSHEERIVMADRQIERLTSLNASRETLVQKTEAVFEKRKQALAQSTIQLEKTKAKKERLIAARDAKPEKKTAEEKAAKRAAKKEEQEKYEMLMSKLKERGKSVDELLAELK